MDSEAQTIDVAMVLAAGLGTRMRHLTAEKPKPMVELAGRCLIDHVLDRLAEAGIRRAVVNLHHHADLLQRHLEGREAAAPVLSYSCERGQVLDTGGGVKNALEALGTGPFLVHNSDAVWIERNGSNLARLVAAFDAARMDALLLLADRETSLGYDGRGDFFMGPDGRIARRGAEAAAPYVFAGVSIAHPRMFVQSPEGPFSLNLLWDRALAQGRLFGLAHDGLWMHVGTPEAVAAAEAQLRAHAPLS